MSSYLDCWVSVARTLFSQALAGEPTLVEEGGAALNSLSGMGFVALLEGDVEGKFIIALDPPIVQAPLLGEGVDQGAAWKEFLREVTEAAAGELLAVSGLRCTVSSFSATEPEGRVSRAFALTTGENAWNIKVREDLKDRPAEVREAKEKPQGRPVEVADSRISPGIELLLDVELEAALRFGCCEMPLGEILELGPGDVVELDRHVSDPVDLVVGNKIVARGDVVLINGNFGLRVTEVAAPQKRLESIRCLF